MCAMFCTVFFLCHDFCCRLQGRTWTGKLFYDFTFWAKNESNWTWLTLFICPLVKPFNPEALADVCEHLFSYYSQGGKDNFVVAPLPGSFKVPLIYHHDKWELEGNTLVRYHKRPRRTLFSPHGTRDRPVELDELANMRETFLEYEHGTKEHIVDKWRTSEDPC